jgi:hypothetical protein
MDMKFTNWKTLKERPLERPRLRLNEKIMLIHRPVTMK